MVTVASKNSLKKLDSNLSLVNYFNDTLSLHHNGFMVVKPWKKKNFQMVMIFANCSLIEI